MKRGKMKKWVSLLLGSVLCVGAVAVPLTSGSAVQASSATSYEVHLPTDVAITNVQDAEGSMQFIDVAYSDESIGDKLDGTVVILDKDGTKINTTYFAVQGKIRIPLSNFASHTTYTLSITPDGLDAYSQTFTTGTIVDDTDVAVGLEVVKKTLKKYSVLDMLRGYDLDSVKITMAENTSGVEVLLTRDLTKDFEEMTKLGEIAAGTTEQTFEITGYNIAKYQYVIVKGTETVREINAYVSSESMKGVKARPIGGDNVELRFCSWSDLHMQMNQREVNSMTDVLSKAKSKQFGEQLDAMVLLGDIHYMYRDDDAYNSEMLKRYKRIETILTDNGYGYSNLDVDSDDIVTTIYTAGNHEYEGGNSDKNDVHAQRFVDQVGSFHAHKVVNGFHFIAASADYNAMMREDAAAWTKAEIEKAVAEDPTGTKPIFVFAHSKALETVTTKDKHGAINTTYYPGKSTEFVEWLKGYPQVVYISGHSHYAEQLETNIVQVGFTQVTQGMTGGGNISGLGTLTSGSVSDPIDSLSEENTYRPQGLIVETKNNVVYVYRIDFKTGGQIGNPWVIDTEGLQEQTARPYYTSERYDYSVAPYFEDGAAENITVEYTRTPEQDGLTDTVYSMDAKITFPQAKSNDIYGDKVPMAYQIYIYDAETGTKVKDYGRWSDALYWSENVFDVADETHHYEMDETWTMDIPELQLGRIYKVDIHAVNSFVKRSEPITVYLDYSNPENITTSVDAPKANIVDNSYYKTEVDGYKFFNSTTGDVVSQTYEATTSYSLEATFHMPMQQNGRLIGTDAHNLSIQYIDITPDDKKVNPVYCLVYTYTVDGVAKTLLTTMYYTNTCVDIVGTCDGTSAKLYVAGVLVKTAAISGTVDALSGDITVGNGIFASVLKARVYNKALSLNEVKALNKETGDNLPKNGWVTKLSVQDISTNATIFDGLVLDKLIDGTTSNYTALSGATPREILLDLGRVYDLETVVLYQRTSSANDTKHLKITMSEDYIALADAASRKLIHYDEEGDGFTQGAVPNYMKVEMSDGNNQARYVYLTSYNSDLLVINEFMIFGKAITTKE